jgi:BMFP domain-containing protein YqiC
MDSTKNFFEAWMNTQSQIAGKIKETFENSEVLNKSVELYKSWFDNQKSLADSILSSMQGKGSEQMPEMVQKWMEAQAQAGTRLMEFFGQSAQQPSSSFNMAQSAQDWYGNITKGLQAMMGNTQQFSPNFMQMPQQANNLLNNAQTYLQMMDMWQKGHKMWQTMSGGKTTLGAEDMMKAFDMNQYKGVMDSMFQFMTPDKSQNFLQQIQQYNQTILERFPEMQKMFGEQWGKMTKPEAMLHSGLQTISDVYQNFSEQFHKVINPYFTTAPAGREKEMTTLMMQVQDKLVQYYIKSTEIQQLAYEIGKKAMEKTLQQAIAKVGSNLEAMPFDEFYNLWVDTMENDTIAFFSSLEYSTLQGKVVQLGLEIKGGLERQMEKMLAGLPVVPRSEMDALNQTVHELKRKVRDLENAQHDKTGEEDETANGASAQSNGKTTTRKTVKKQ